MSNTLNQLYQNQIFILILVFWEMFWKGMALWYSSKKDQKIWFIAILVINSLGLLPIIYLVLFKLNYFNKIKLLIKRK